VRTPSLLSSLDYDLKDLGHNPEGCSIVCGALKCRLFHRNGRTQVASTRNLDYGTVESSSSQEQRTLLIGRDSNDFGDEKDLQSDHDSNFNLLLSDNRGFPAFSMPIRPNMVRLNPLDDQYGKNQPFFRSL